MYLYADGLALAVWGSLGLFLAGCFVFWAANQLLLWRQTHDAGQPHHYRVPRLSVKVRLVWPEAANDSYQTPKAA